MKPIQVEFLKMITEPKLACCKLKNSLSEQASNKMVSKFSPSDREKRIILSYCKLVYLPLKSEILTGLLQRCSKMVYGQLAVSFPSGVNKLVTSS